MESRRAPVRVGVLSFHNSKETKALCNAVADLGHEPAWLRPENTNIHAAADGLTVDPDVDVVINRLLLSRADRPLEELELANSIASLRPMVNEPPAVLTAIHKFATATRLSANGIPTPESYLALTGPELEAGREHFDQAIQKAGIGTHGETIRQIREGTSLPPKFGTKRTFLQEYIDQEDNQSDLRAYVVGGDVIGAMERATPDDDWRANVARGGTTRDVTDEIPSPVLTLAAEATDALGLDVAGVDFMEHEGDWKVLEVNPTAGFKGLFGATGHSPAPSIAQLAIERVGGRVDADRVAALATQLDDSVPDCKPTRRAASGQPTVGLTEEVVVNGQQSSTTTTAKVDTGAKRTSMGIDLASDIGAGPIQSSTKVRHSSHSSSKTRPLVDVEVLLEDRWHTLTVSVENRSHMSHQLLLGRDLLTDYEIDLSGDEDATPTSEE
ncbi:ATP-grasp domain-containing protein [Haloarcula onubensis]|uniref:ATP-grasp domain-containing protein n=1 Tax=Haloarcula onubensis TaxID=2950539 RepID=A0ABU2FMK8_9EURY|nr:ATP-grasp domain-containing protein [Halomicroarcula sp. S3CR25-11]MDS0281998.1 ATP-grasp domain-containing protein [Halomicroarcula sp. S3CR25-11]